MLEDRAPNGDVPFIRASTVGRTLTLESRVYDVWGHWDVAQNRFRLCGLERCALCHEGFKAERRFIIRVSDELGDGYLVELRERLLQPLRTLDGIARSGRKPRFVLRRLGSARNSPIAIERIEESASGTFYDLARLVAKLYMPPIEVEDVISGYVPKPRFESEEDVRLAEVMSRRKDSQDGSPSLRLLGL